MLIFDGVYHAEEREGNVVTRQELSIPVLDANTMESGTATENHPYLVVERLRRVFYPRSRNDRRF